jgi:TrpR family transcriptional regulator, trp operon repressor
MKKATNGLINSVLSIKSAPILDAFFNEIFTHSERKDFMLRWELMKMLMEGLPQRDIAAKLGVSLCKITRGARIIKDKKSITYTLLKQHKINATV